MLTLDFDKTVAQQGLGFMPFPGTGSLDPLPALDVADFERVLAVNVTSVFLGLRGAFRQQVADLLEQNLGPRRRRGHCRGLGGMLLLQPVDALDRHEQHERNDGEVEDGLDEGAVLDEHVLANRIFAE